MSVKLAPPWRVSVFSRPFEFELSFLLKSVTHLQFLSIGCLLVVLLLFTIK